MIPEYFKSSIGKKQIVAVTGLMLILFLLGHMAGNLLLFLGPEAFNAYAKKLAGMRPGLYLIEAGLLLVFLIHMHITALLVMQNYRARGQERYAVQVAHERTIANRIMPYTGMMILIFVAFHLIDFTFTDKYGGRSFIEGQSYGLYGVVYNSFTEPFHSILYIICLICLGFHLSHGVESFIQSFGFNDARMAPVVKKVSLMISFVITLAYCSIPIYVLVRTHCI